MSSQADNNKRIAKNTLMLYFRMILLMLISLNCSAFAIFYFGCTVSERVKARIYASRFRQRMFRQ